MAMMSENLKTFFDPRISTGNILTIVGFIITLIIGWTTLDKRVVILEESRNTQMVRDKHQDFLLNQQATSMEKTALEIKQSILRIEQKIDDINRATAR